MEEALRAVLSAPSADDAASWGTDCAGINVSSGRGGLVLGLFCFLFLGVVHCCLVYAFQSCCDADRSEPRCVRGAAREAREDEEAFPGEPPSSSASIRARDCSRGGSGLAAACKGK